MKDLRQEARASMSRITVDLLDAVERGAANAVHEGPRTPLTTQWGPVSGHRSGGIDFKRLIQGEDSAPDNFEFSFVRTAGDTTPAT